MMNLGGGFDLLGKGRKKTSSGASTNTKRNNSADVDRKSSYGSTDRATKSTSTVVSRSTTKRGSDPPKSVTFVSNKGSNFFSDLAEKDESPTAWELDEENAGLLMANEKDEITTVSSGGSSVRDIPLPMKLRPFVKRLEDLDDLHDEEILNIVFIVRLGDAMLKVNYATFLVRSFVDEICQKLNVEDLDLEIAITGSRWSFQQGTVTLYNRINTSHDGFAMRAFSKIARGVLDGTVTVAESLRDIDNVENHEFTGFEKFYRQYPGRMVVLPLIASTGSIAYFGGTWIDGACCLCTGFLLSFVDYQASKYSQVSGVSDIFIAMITAAMSAFWAIHLKGYVCFPAQVLGLIIFYVPVFNFVLSFYEISQSLVVTGIARLISASIKSYVLAFGLVVGLWMSGNGDETVDLTMACSDVQYRVDSSYFPFIFPFVAIAKLMKFKVGPIQWVTCILTQLVAINSQFLLAKVWNQPLFVSNFIPAFLTTLASHAIIYVLSSLYSTGMTVQNSAYTIKAPNQRESNVREKFGSAKKRYLSFKDTGWVREGEGTTKGGYMRNSRRQYQRADLWFCLAPALTILVPGAKIWRVAFFSIVEGSAADEASKNNFAMGSLMSGLLVIGMGIVMGVRLGLVTLWCLAQLAENTPLSL